MTLSLENLKTYILRGFKNMLEILHEDYFKLLKEIGVAKDLISHFVKVSGSTMAKTSQLYSSQWLEGDMRSF